MQLLSQPVSDLDEPCRGKLLQQLADLAMSAAIVPIDARGVTEGRPAL